MTTLHLTTEVVDMKDKIEVFTKTLAKGKDDQGREVELTLSHDNAHMTLRVGTLGEGEFEHLDVMMLVQTWMDAREAEAAQEAREGARRTLHPDGGYEYDHEARPDDDPEPGYRCKDCGGALFDHGTDPAWLHVEDWQNQ